MDNLADDPSFIDAIVHEVKSQGLFDQFRKECLADVDTKPAYQNLRQRVESSVSKFLSQQKWSDNIRHKNQLREKLRKNIIDSGFLESGVERIVDQVVNPKISTVFHPKVEEIVYNYLGIEKPAPTLNGGSELDVQTDFLLEDLEAVSPDSDKKSSSASSDHQHTVEPNANDELNESKEIIDDFESPAFEPLEVRPPSQTKHESNDSHTSAISGLTSQESVEEEPPLPSEEPAAPGEPNSSANQLNGHDVPDASVEEAISSPVKASPEIVQNDSQLSQVSSNSRLSIITNSENNGQQSQPQVTGNPRLDITEEAQMPKFNENSNEEEGELRDSNDEDEFAGAGKGELQPQRSNFDLRQESYEFKGTERTNRYLDEEIENSAGGISAGNNGDASAKEDMLNSSGEQPKELSSPKFDENSSQSERSLRICEESTLEQRTLNATGNLLNNCENSVKTPLNDEHSTESAPDVDKMDASQVEVVSLAAIQQHADNNKEKRSERHRERDRDRDDARKHSSSSSRDRRSHSSSKHSSSSSSSSSNGGRSKSSSSHHDRHRSENGNGNSNGGSSRRSHDKKKDEDDHYSSHDKPSKRRRSTDRDSNDGTENGKSARSGGEGMGGSGAAGEAGGNGSVRGSQSPPKRDNGNGGGQQDNESSKLNESLDSSFEGFDEAQLQQEKRISPKKLEKVNKVLSKLSEKTKLGSSPQKVTKKVKKVSDRSKETGKGVPPANMDVFAFSFEKPAKLGKNGEVLPDEDIPTSPPPAQQQEQPTVAENPAIEELPAINDSMDQLEEGIIVLEPTELAKVIGADLPTTNVDEDTWEPSFPKTDPADLVTLATQPVVVDQMLTNGDNMDLELLIGEKQLRGDETTMGKIQQGLDVVKNKIRKPKIASNFSEARKLMKIRKQIERQEKKQQEQAMVLAKKLLDENGMANEDDQGIELEFVCDGNRKSSGPIISSPVRQRTKLNNSLEDEVDLLYFPEESQVFDINQDLFDFLKQKTDGAEFPVDFTVERNTPKLYTLVANEQKNVRSLFPTDEEKQCQDNTLAVEIREVQTSAPEAAESSEEASTKSPKLQKFRATSIDSDVEASPQLEPEPKKQEKTSPTANQQSRKRKLSRSPPKEGKKADTDLDEVGVNKKIAKTSSFEDSHCKVNADTINVEPIKENIQNTRTTKARRIGLPKPKATAILTIDIADVSLDKDPAGGAGSDNNNDILKAQRYSSEDLYKPRSLNSLRSRTRTRASDVPVQAEVGI